MKISPKLIAWPIAAVVNLLRWTCRLHIHDDPRPGMRESGQAYAYAILHAHQVAAAMYTEPNTAAMVSRSGDGDLMIQAYRSLRITPVRGSNRTKSGDRGGASALAELVQHVGVGSPVILAVDGPRGPRGRARKGIASLSQRSGAAVLGVILVPRWRLRFSKAWDRFQVPLPFSRIDAYFAEPILSEEGESVESFRRRVEDSLNALETHWDPAEAA